MSTAKNRPASNRDRATHSPAAISAALMVFLAGGAAFGQTSSGEPPSSAAPKAAQPAHSSHSAKSGAKSSGGGSTGVTTITGSPAPVMPAQPTPANAGLNAAGNPGSNGSTAPVGTDTPPSEPKSDSVVRVNDSLVVDLHVNDEDLTNVLQMLSIQSQRNIVASNNVNAKVKADLYGVTFYEALDAILHVNGYGYIDKGNFIYVYTLDELQQIEKASRVRVSKVVKLNYLNAIDAAEFVKPLLSEGGQIKTNGKTDDYAVGQLPTGKDNYAHDATLVVYDYQEHVDEIQKLVKELDTKPAQVLVEATILQTQLNESNAFGVDFSLIADMNFTDFAGSGGPLKSVDNMIAGKGKAAGGSDARIPTNAVGDPQGRGIQSTPGNTGGPGTLKLGIVANDVAAFVKMLDETTDTTILSNPKVLALNRQPARVLVGRKVGYLNTTSTDTTTTQSVEFLDTGTQLNFRPFITSEGLIRLELKPQVSEAVIRDTKDATGAAVTIPDEITNEMVTNVMVRDGQTVVLGGLFRESTQATRRQVPFLGDIPLLGAAFRGHEDETQRSEIIFLITPSIVNDQVLTASGKDAVDYIDRARSGARDGILPWSRDKLTSLKLVEAEKLASEGQTEKALWKIDQSLAMNPVQPDAIAMRERLTNEKKVTPSRSLLEHIMHKESRSSTRAGIDNPNFIPLSARMKAQTVTASVEADAVSTAEDAMKAHGITNEDTAAPFNNSDEMNFDTSVPTNAEGSATDLVEPIAAPEMLPEASPEAVPSAAPSTTPSTEPQPPAPAQPEVSPATQPEVQPPVQPETQPGTSPSTEPATTPSTNPETNPEATPATNPETTPGNGPGKGITASTTGFQMSGGLFADANRIHDQLVDAENVLWGTISTVASARNSVHPSTQQAALKAWVANTEWRKIESPSATFAGLVRSMRMAQLSNGRRDLMIASR